MQGQRGGPLAAAGRGPCRRAHGLPPPRASVRRPGTSRAPHGPIAGGPRGSHVEQRMPLMSTSAQAKAWTQNFENGKEGRHGPDG